MNLIQTGYISNIYRIGSCFLAIIPGFYLRWTGDFKKKSLSFGLPLTLLGFGLMIHFRQPDVRLGYIIMCQIFIAFGGGYLVVT